MIVITGPGRSGTSFLARLYQELGFSPIIGGGGWDSGISGGLEDVEIGRLNARLVDELGLRSSLHRFADPARRVRGRFRQRSRGDRRPAAPADPTGAGAGPSVAWGNRIAARVVGRHVPLMKWDRLSWVAERHGDEMRRLAASRVVVKDPAFCLTLGAWAASGAEIEHVVVSLRSLEATTAGLLRTGHLPGWSDRVAADHVAYRIGLLMTTLIDHRLSYSILRFPGFLEDPAELCDALHFPTPVSCDRVLEACRALRNPDLVSSWK